MSFEGIIDCPDTEYGFRIVELAHVKDNGQDQYVFIAVDPEKYPRYKRSRTTGRSPAIGAIELYRGSGRNPSLDIIHEVKYRFNIQREISDSLVRKAMSVINVLDSRTDSHAGIA